jgi:acetylornithine deacetylase/succinyl-diaminopimelate desuccinylase-like protein
VDPLAYAAARRHEQLRTLARLVAIPSVSAEPAHASDVRRCAVALAAELKAVGLERVGLIETGGQPLVYGDWLHAPSRPTVLLYGHYDVVPAGPAAAWLTPPFRLVHRGEYVHGRGASDDKGPLCCHLAAIRAWLATRGKLPLNVRCVYEGEEEIGSPGLARVLARRPRRFACDLAVISDTRMARRGRPAIIYALRGNLTAELEALGPRHELHSGAFGGTVANPVEALCRIVGELHRPDGTVAIPGFYDDVRAIAAPERARLRRHGSTDGEVAAGAGVRHLPGEPSFTPFERTVIRPTLTTSGFGGGWNGPGVKSVVPARARAKLTMRLVPDQDPAVVAGLLRRHVLAGTPGGIRLSVTIARGTSPSLVDPRHPGVAAAVRAARAAFGSEPALLRSGGSVGAVPLFKRYLGAETILLGFALPDDRMHAPNERFHLPTFRRGIATCVNLLPELGRSLEARVPHAA